MAIYVGSSCLPLFACLIFLFVSLFACLFVCLFACLLVFFFAYCNNNKNGAGEHPETLVIVAIHILAVTSHVLKKAHTKFEVYIALKPHGRLPVS